jgi:hypothetical protein
MVLQMRLSESRVLPDGDLALLMNDDRITPAGSVKRVKADDCNEMRVLEAELTVAFRRFSVALRASRDGGLLIGDSDTEAAGACIAHAWMALGEHDAKHGCRRGAGAVVP